MVEADNQQPKEKEKEKEKVKVKGPASYFPSIEKKYGRPIAEWQQLIRGAGLTKHGELVSWLKA